MNDPDSTPPAFASTISIVGVGLIGGSIAGALKKRGFPGTILGVGRNAQRLAAAKTVGLIDDYHTDIADTKADFWVFCTPVDRIASGVLSVKRDSKSLILITDAGSVKAPICKDVRGKLPKGVEFVGSHPLAGSEQRGFEHAEADLFLDRLCVLTPDDSTSPDALKRLRNFWKFLGMRLAEMDPAAHDAALAQTSHLPHFVASVLAATLEPQNAHLAATGFADTTRIAAGDPELWSAIFMQNAEAVLAALTRYAKQFEAFRQALVSHDAPALIDLLQQAKTSRDNLEQHHRTPDIRTET